MSRDFLLTVTIPAQELFQEMLFMNHNCLLMALYTVKVKILQYCKTNELILFLNSTFYQFRVV